MPELPEVETVVRGLETVLLGRRFASVVAHRPDLRRALPVDLGQRLTGARVTGLSRRAKYGVITTDRDDALVFHLGMSGRMRLDPPAIGSHDHVVFATDDGHVIAFNDARRFGSLDLMTAGALTDWAPFAALGPEPLGDGLSADHLAAAFAGRIAPVKTLLLDQRIVAGLGNIYVCEALHMAGIAPTLAAGRISRKRLAALVDAIRAVLTAAIAAGGSTLRDHVQVSGELGYFQKQWRVYGREGEPCPSCGASVARIVQGGRSTFVCAACQR
jgi:formamidopyrimidine-DNA glycosylase